MQSLPGRSINPPDLSIPLLEGIPRNRTFLHECAVCALVPRRSCKVSLLICVTIERVLTESRDTDLDLESIG
jgi:hypothetical protein